MRRLPEQRSSSGQKPLRIFSSRMNRTFWRAAALWRRKHHVYLGMSFGTWTPGARFPLENKFVLIEPTGQTAWEYLKARPTPGPEAAMSVKSDGRLRHLDTVYGRLVAAICYDTDFPRLMVQAGAQRADVVLSPAGDWRAIDPRHTEIASFRAIEQGFNLVRQSNGGLSAAYDYQGRRLASMDEYQSTDLTLIAQVPTPGRQDDLFPLRRLARVAEYFRCPGVDSWRLAQNT